jgi:hypothetical protein
MLYSFLSFLHRASASAVFPEPTGLKNEAEQERETIERGKYPPIPTVNPLSSKLRDV